jgi:hypothetical protein
MSAMISQSTRRWIAFVAAGATTALVGCEETSGTVPTVCPDAQLFEEAVSPYLERRCGSLDCHGQDTRPMRILGEYGLRRQVELGEGGGNVSGGRKTTEAEYAANLQAVCALEPERMAEALAKFGASVDRLRLVGKPRNTIRHKGGRVVEEGDPGDRCIVGWISAVSESDADEVRKQCATALSQLP